MGINTARIGDTGNGICCQGDPHGASGVIVTGAGLCFAEGLNIARIGDILVSNCHGRVGVIVGGSPTVFAEGSNIARIGDSFSGCFSGQIVTGAGTVFN
jgi:uncharacterized Zn-binding protein involved in type VI secretion